MVRHNQTHTNSVPLSLSLTYSLTHTHTHIHTLTLSPSLCVCLSLPHLCLSLTSTVRRQHTSTLPISVSFQPKVFAVTWMTEENSLVRSGCWAKTDHRSLIDMHWSSYLITSNRLTCQGACCIQNTWSNFYETFSLRLPPLRRNTLSSHKLDSVHLLPSATWSTRLTWLDSARSAKLKIVYLPISGVYVYIFAVIAVFVSSPDSTARGHGVWGRDYTIPEEVARFAIDFNVCPLNRWVSKNITLPMERDNLNCIRQIFAMTRAQPPLI